LFDLDALCGNFLRIFLIEKPPGEAERPWKPIDTGITNSKQEILSDLIQPFDRSIIYGIARMFGLRPKVLPCLVFFRDIDSIDFVVYPLKNSWEDKKLTSEFENLFSNLENAYTSAKMMVDREINELQESSPDISKLTEKIFKHDFDADTKKFAIDPNYETLVSATRKYEESLKRIHEAACDQYWVDVKQQITNRNRAFHFAGFVSHPITKTIWDIVKGLV